MIIGSPNSPFTLHGFLGYSALVAILIWKYYKKNEVQIKLSKSLLFYTLLVSVWWVIAYVTGSMLVIMK